MSRPVIVNAGPDENDPSDGEVLLEARLIVYAYESYGYDASGQALAVVDGEKLYLRNLGHCSCYGAWDGAESLNDWTPTTRVELEKLAVHPDYRTSGFNPWNLILEAFDKIESGKGKP